MLSIQKTNQTTGEREVVATCECGDIYGGEVEIDPHRIVWEREGKDWIVRLDDEGKMWVTLRNTYRVSDEDSEQEFTTKDFRVFVEAVMEADRTLSKMSPAE